MRKSRTADRPVVRERTEAATVWLPKARGQGVLVPGGLILTAAHCVGWTASGHMAFGDMPPTVPIRTAAGRTFSANVFAVEPVADIAVLGAADSQAFAADAEAFERFCDETLPVPVSGRDFDLEVAVPVLIRTHLKTWVEATTTRYGHPSDPPGYLAHYDAESAVKGGTSGGPVVDLTGDLVGVVSVASEGNGDGGPCQGTMPRPHLALPGWVWLQIKTAQRAKTR